MQRYRSWLGPLAGLVVVVLLVRRIGADAFVDGLRHLDAASLAAAAVIAVLTTVCGSWRWVLVARGLGTELSLRSAVAESYRSQFLNVTLPGGMLGDVHRGVRHGRGGGDLGRGVRSVVWERSAGQVVLAVLTAGVLVLAPGPASALFRPGSRATTALAGLGVIAVLAIAAVALVSRGARRRGVATGVVRVVRAARADVRAGLLGPRTWPGIAVSSVIVVVGHAATFVVAARAAGVTAPVTQLLPPALVVLMAMGLPLNVAGWGPREGAAAWAFSAAGIGAAAGVGTAVAYGVMAFVASLPGAVVLAVARRDRGQVCRATSADGAGRG